MTQLSMEPISWLTLERYALDELSPTERARVEQRLTQSSADRACLDEILNDRSELPPLPSSTPAKVLSIDAARARRRSWSYVGGVLAVAAALALALLRPSDVPASRRQVHDGVKGGEVALVMVGEKQGEQPSHFFVGERFKLLVTCPKWLGQKLHVTVFQAGQRYQPLTELDDSACGNRVPWPGARRPSSPAGWCREEPRERATEPSWLEPFVVCARVLPRSPD